MPEHALPFAVILPAAGRSSRFGRNKLLESLAGRAVIWHSLAAFLRRGDVAQVVIPAADADAIRVAIDCSDSRVTVCPGGEHRAASVRNALAAIDPAIAWVAVHDAARPLVSQEVIDRTLAAAFAHGAAVPAMPVALTIKECIGPLPAKVARTVPRRNLWAMQTPQIMRRDALARAFDACPLPLEQVTDDVQLIELAGGEVWLVDGEDRNLKITTAIDMRLAEALLVPTAPPGR